MKKKTYEQPEIEVVEMSAADIICTSGDSTFSIENNGVIGNGDNGDWGDDLNW